MEDEWITVFDDDAMEEAAVRKRDIIEVSADGYLFTIIGHKYHYTENFFEFMKKLESMQMKN